MLHCSWNEPFMLKNVLKCVTDLGFVEQKVAFYSDFPTDSSWLLACTIRLIFAVHTKRSISDKSADCSDELAVLDVTRFSRLFTVAGLADWNMTSGSSATATACLIEQSSTCAKLPYVVSKSRYARGCTATAVALILCPHCALCPICSKLCPPNRRSPNCTFQLWETGSPGGL